MSDTYSDKGSCLCGEVKIEATQIKKTLGACHCGMCRKWTGGPYLALDCGTDVKIEGESNVSFFDSSQWAERAFCKKCGTNLFYRLKQTGQTIVSAGIFQSSDQIVFDHQIFIDKKPDYYNFANDTKNMTEAEVFAQYS